MPSKKKKYNARFPPARIKKIMQTDEEIGKVAAAVPVIISRALELFLESLLKKACQVTQSRNAKTMTTSHLTWLPPCPTCRETEKTIIWMERKEPEGAGSPGAAGRMVVLEERGKIRSNLGQTRSRRMILKTQRQMGRRRCHSPHPNPAGPWPSSRGEVVGLEAGVGSNMVRGVVAQAGAKRSKEGSGPTQVHNVRTTNLPSPLGKPFQHPRCANGPHSSLGSCWGEAGVLALGMPVQLV
ncbi:dr1-associated corepressor isoform X1 [Vombatus ursinus]|uniref:dr1-associated corepressor isoform X1 n=1 Tax=Vombatus ursinus TaxID=29139 RepID=UPI000FFD249E|nr:dr1-associated corepressor isoform X1 [Vombatus ursinus]